MTVPEAVRVCLTPAIDHGLPVVTVLVPAVPTLRRGVTVWVGASTWLAMALAAGPSAAGSWTVAVGLPSLGVVAAAEVGVDLRRLALVEVEVGQWATAVAAAIDSVDVVVAGVPAGLQATVARRLSARARERRSVLIVVERPGAASAGPAWPERADLRLQVERWWWTGLGAGDGHLLRRRATVTVNGREAGGRRRQVDLSMPPGPATVVGERAPSFQPLRRQMWSA